jgi:hypothetical protein
MTATRKMSIDRRPGARVRVLSGWLAGVAILSTVGFIATACSSPDNRSSINAKPVVAVQDLPKIPWEGGPDYWKKFAKADVAGWDDPNFFPIAIWYNGISSDAEVQYDKDHGINTYMGMSDTTPYSLFETNGVYWIGGKLNDTFTEQSRNWVGTFLDDEVDGRFTPEAGRQHLQALANATPPGFFKYANFTQMVISHYMPATDAQPFVNNFTDSVSVDMYWYTIPYCGLQPYSNAHLVPVSEANCRTASSYGKTMKALRMQDAADGKLQPLWQFVENLNGGPGEGPFVANISAGQLQGAVMNSIINEARGIVYFNQSLSGPCGGGSVLRLSQVLTNFCGAEQMEAVKTVNSRIRELAPVINTQSYDFSLGNQLDTMLKIRDGYAYIFAMVDGNSAPGARNFKLPDGIKANQAEVLYENRTVPVDTAGSFTDTFAAEYSYHIYKVKL